jgi:hypothetical protein
MLHALTSLIVAVVTPVYAQTTKPAVVKDSRNTFTFDHLALRGETDAPMVLEVGDGDFFQVLITHTDPTLFKYSISATQDEAGPLTTTFEPDANGVQAHPDSWASVTHRHDKHFNRYRVTISEIAAQAAATTDTKKSANSTLQQTLGITTPVFDESDGRPVKLLHSVAFDLWVTTRPEWKVSFSGGVAVSSLTDHKFFVKTDDTGRKTVEEDTNGRDAVRHDVIALANLYFDHQYWRGLMFGTAFGIGDTGNSTPRYYVGPSIVLGRNFIFTAGATFGSVAMLPSGQTLHEAPTSDNVLNNLGSRYQRGYFGSIAFAFIDKETEFRNGFTSSTTTGSGSAPSGAGASANGNALSGTYQTSDKKDEKVEIATANGKTTMTLTIDADTAKQFATALENRSAITMEKKNDTTYQTGDDTAIFTTSGDTTTLQFKHGQTTIVTASKKKVS